MFVLINRTTQRLVAANEDPSILGDLIAKRYPDDAVVVAPIEEKRSFSCFEAEELCAIMSAERNVRITPDTAPYATLLTWFQQLVFEFVGQFNGVPVEAPPVKKGRQKRTGSGVSSAPTPAPTPTQSPVTEKPRGGITGAMWDVFDQVYAELRTSGRSLPEIKKVAFSRLTGNKESTLSTQWSRWRKAHTL